MILPILRAVEVRLNADFPELVTQISPTEQTGTLSPILHVYYMRNDKPHTSIGFAVTGTTLVMATGPYGIMKLEMAAPEADPPLWARSKVEHWFSQTDRWVRFTKQIRACD